MITMLLILAAAAAQPIPMIRPRPVSGDVQAYPRIAAPANAAQRRINRALDRLDAKVRTAIRECFADSVNPTSWERRIDATMRGPEFLSYLVTDEVDCGNAYPNESHLAIVYDLRTGEPVDWTRLLPSKLTGRLELLERGDGTRVVTLHSPRLFALYSAGYSRALDPEDIASCEDAPTAFGEDGVAMLAWLDAKAGGLALQFDFSHAMQTCSTAVVVPLATLRREGASPRLLAALAARNDRVCWGRDMVD